MKNAVQVIALLGLMLGSSLVCAEVKYGPVITIKPKGAMEERVDPKPKPDLPQDVNNKQKQKPVLLLPAIQKNSDSESETVPGNTVKGQDQAGNLDRDIIRRTVPSTPNPPPKPK